ncbi:gamma-glutamylcyclotransferase [Rhizobium laguerreae]|uniref:gamma-glutamylcyclotransferase n=1 Tax=Rhizobium laguerreae TaxID=1076926 RepID=UPI001C9252D4|nr:gamma-glutamylcyclotransferase [Rhizobium laguerreae]MBY3417077.1 gamma-glutamylcyclotransferase [Rhizobium laguerreae]
MDKHVGVTRQQLEAGTWGEHIARDAPAVVLWTDEQRSESVQATLEARPPGDVWVFAYGSLIWNPTFKFEESRVAVIKDWHRSFCLSVSAGRGTVETPGLVLGLDQGGTCAGVAFRIAEPDLESELAVLWKREMITGAYAPRWLDVFDADGDRFGSAIAFTIDHNSPNYAGNLEREVIITRLASASGFLGTSADYLFQTAEGLRSRGVLDDELDALAIAVTKSMESL